MTEVDRLFEQYISEHRAGGEAAPWAYLEQVEGTDREELAALLDAYLARAPGQEWDAEAFAGSPASQLAEHLSRALNGEAGLWPVMLPRARERAKIERSQVAKRLAAALGVGEREEKVRNYYHDMEYGLIPASGVSERVLDALGEIVGVAAETIRNAGRALGPGQAPAAGTAFARTAIADERYEPAPPSVAPASAAAADEPWDEVDELFRGG